MEFWLGWFDSDYTQVTKIAREAERLGYTGVAISDHVAMPADNQSQHPIMGHNYPTTVPQPEPLTTIAAMAAVTEKLQFITYALVLPMRDPFSVAKQAGALSMLTQGRFGLGVAAGWLEEEIALLGHDPRQRGARLDEMLDVIRQCWHDGKVNHQGHYYQCSNVNMLPAPTQDIPVYVAGGSPAALRRAARHQGWLGLNNTLDELSEMESRLATYRGRALVDDPDFKCFVAPPYEPDAELVRILELRGYRGMVVMPWTSHDPETFALDYRLEKMAHFADRFIQHA